MDRPGHKSAKTFIGTEVEHTPAHGQLTLFVVGVQPSEIIIQQAELHCCRHIFFGANQSFPNLAMNDADAWQSWEQMIWPCLHQQYLCTLDLDVACAEGLLDTGLVEHELFIPMISVKLPYIRQFGYNATLKIDDRDFKATNPGVWCHSLHDLQNKSVFTDWSKYIQDKVLT